MPPKLLVADDEPDLELLLRQKFRREIARGSIEFVFAHNGAEYGDCGEVHFDRDDILVLCTDGIREASSPTQGMFGRPRMQEVIRRNCTRSSEEIARRITDAVLAFCDGLPVRDDMTLTVVKRTEAV